MCFSAAGSFAISGVLTGIGVTSIVRNTAPQYRTFAAIPFLFAAQQAAEGCVWLTIRDGSHLTLHKLAVMAFLAIALVVWPVWLPLALRRIETNRGRRRIMTVLSWFGALVSAFAAVLLTRWHPVAAIAGHSIRYDYAASTNDASNRLDLFAYVIATVLPFFVSTAHMARTIGAVLLISLFATAVIARDALTSVWCFFAAILSGLIVIAIERGQQLHPTVLPESPAPVLPQG
jgi:hypothetical protein